MKPTIIIPTCKTPVEIAPLMCNLEGFSLGCRIIATCEKASAAVNRNAGILHVIHTAETEEKGEKCEIPKILIMIDDDIAGICPTPDHRRFLATINVEEAAAPAIVVDMHWPTALRKK